MQFCWYKGHFSICTYTVTLLWMILIISVWIYLFLYRKNSVCTYWSWQSTKPAHENLSCIKGTCMHAYKEIHRYIGTLTGLLDWSLHRHHTVRLTSNITGNFKFEKGECWVLILKIRFVFVLFSFLYLFVLCWCCSSVFHHMFSTWLQKDGEK